MSKNPLKIYKYQKVYLSLQQKYEYVTKSKKNMKHNSLQKLVTIYNLVREGGNYCFMEADTHSNTYTDERKEFVKQVRTHGYDILTDGDILYKEKLEEYNRVLELQAKKNGESSYEKYLPKELCVCGEWLFTELEFVTESKEEKIKDARGGQREGAGRKAKYSNLVYTKTSVIRVPEIYKKDIKDFVCWLIGKATDGQNIREAISLAEIALEEKGDKENAQLLKELRKNIPSFSVNKQE